MIVGIGVDLVHIARVERLLSSKGQRALERLFTEEERRYALARMEPARPPSRRCPATLAPTRYPGGRWRS
jgi:phosphopantetheine--protein transferase-like protein